MTMRVQGRRRNQIAAVALGVFLALTAAAVARHLTATLDGNAIAGDQRLRTAHDATQGLRASIVASSLDCPEAWCGSWKYSNGLGGHTFEVGPAGFYYEAFGCNGWIEIALGRIEHADPFKLQILMDLHVVSEKYAAGGHPFTFGPVLYIVPWGNDRYLVPDALMTDFCVLVGKKGSDAMAYVDYPRKVAEDWSWYQPSDLVGSPTVPDEYKGYLR